MLLVGYNNIPTGAPSFLQRAFNSSYLIQGSAFTSVEGTYLGVVLQSLASSVLEQIRSLATPLDSFHFSQVAFILTLTAYSFLG